MRKYAVAVGCPLPGHPQTIYPIPQRLDQLGPTLLKQSGRCNQVVRPELPKDNPDRVCGCAVMFLHVEEQP